MPPCTTPEKRKTKTETKRWTRSDAHGQSMILEDVLGGFNAKPIPLFISLRAGRPFLVEPRTLPARPAHRGPWDGAVPKGMRLLQSLQTWAAD